MQIANFLKEAMKGRKGLGALLNSFTLRYLDSDKFQEEFGKMTPEEMVKFIMDPDNAYKIGQWSYRQRNPGGRENCHKAKRMLRESEEYRF